MLVITCTAFCSDALLRATWIPLNQGICDQPDACKSSIHSLVSQYQVNAVFVDVWNGIAHFDSQVVGNFSGQYSVGNDVLGFAVQALEEFPNVDLYAWIEYGFAAASQDCLTFFCKAAQAKGWIIGNHGGFVWMDPEKAAPMMSEMISEIIRKYPRVKGVQLDDHFASPNELGGSADQMTNAAKLILAQNPGKVVLSPATITFSRANLNVNWDDWFNNDIGFSMYTPQVYRSEFAAFANELGVMDARLKSQGQNGPQLNMGIMSDSSQSASDWNDIQQMIKACDSRNYGSVIWYARSILGTYANEFKQIWGAQNATS